jgi:DNA-binding GntR family transcriptional regulator
LNQDSENILSEEVKGLNFRATGLAEIISKTLSRAILQGVFNGGDHLVEVNLQDRFGISRSPLWQAFRNLENRGYLSLFRGKEPLSKRSPGRI